MIYDKMYNLIFNIVFFVKIPRKKKTNKNEKILTF